MDNLESLDDFFNRFPPDHREPHELLFSERIPSFPQSAREAIVDMYCPPNIQHRKSEVKTDPGNQDCIVRSLMGRRRRQERASRLKSWSIRNYQLHLDQMEDPSVVLDVAAYAQVMADALAFMYWSARVDAADVEFVLAPPRAGDKLHDFDSPMLGEHKVWILDFDCCRQLTMDECGTREAAERFYRNDPFFPRPGRVGKESQHLWAVFRDRFFRVQSGNHGGGGVRR